MGKVTYTVNGKEITEAEFLSLPNSVATDSNVQAVRQKLLRRSEAGFKKYGVTTERADLDFKQWMTHLQEELLDAAIYIERVLSKNE